MIRCTYLCILHVLIKPISSFTIRPPTINHDHRPPRWILTSRKSGKNVCISTGECTFARRVTQPDIPILFFDVTFAQKPKGRQIFKTAPPSSSSATAWRKNNYLQYIRFFCSVAAGNMGRFTSKGDISFFFIDIRIRNIKVMKY